MAKTSLKFSFQPLNSPSKMIQVKKQGFKHIMTNCISLINENGGGDGADEIYDSVADRYKAHVKILEQENIRLMAAQNRLVQETNRRSEVLEIGDCEKSLEILIKSKH